MKEAIDLYLDTLREDGKPIPVPTTKAKPVSVPSKLRRKRSARPPKGSAAASVGICRRLELDEP